MPPHSPKRQIVTDYINAAVQHSRELIARSRELLRQTEHLVGRPPKKPEPTSSGG